MGNCYVEKHMQPRHAFTAFKAPPLATLPVSIRSQPNPHDVTKSVGNGEDIHRYYRDKSYEARTQLERGPQRKQQQRKKWRIEPERVPFCAAVPATASASSIHAQAHKDVPP